MSKTASVRARIEPELKARAEKIFEKLGLTTSEAIHLFFREVSSRQRLPFPVETPNEETRAALNDARARRNLASFDHVDALFEDLEK